MLQSTCTSGCAAPTSEETESRKRRRESHGVPGHATPGAGSTRIEPLAKPLASRPRRGETPNSTEGRRIAGGILVTAPLVPRDQGHESRSARAPDRAGRSAPPFERRNDRATSLARAAGPGTAGRTRGDGGSAPRRAAPERTADVARHGGRAGGGDRGGRGARR